MARARDFTPDLKSPQRSPSPRSWSQPSAPAEDLNLNPDPKFQAAVTKSFHPKLKPPTNTSPASAGGLENLVESPVPELSHPLCAVAPGPILHTWKPLAPARSLELCKGGFFSTVLCTEAVYSLGTWFLPSLAARRGFREHGLVSDLASTTSHSRITTTIISKETGTHARIFYVISHIRRFSRDFEAYF